MIFLPIFLIITFLVSIKSINGERMFYGCLISAFLSLVSSMCFCLAAEEVWVKDIEYNLVADGSQPFDSGTKVYVKLRKDDAIYDFKYVFEGGTFLARIESPRRLVKVTYTTQETPKIVYFKKVFVNRWGRYIWPGPPPREIPFVEFRVPNENSILER